MPRNLLAGAEPCRSQGLEVHPGGEMESGTVDHFIAPL